MMMMILGWLRSAFAPVAIVIFIAILIVIFGPNIGLHKPWHWVIAGALVVLALIGYGIWRLIQRRREKAFEDGILGQAQQDMSRASVARRAEMEALVARWKEAIRLLRESSAKGGGILQKLPWFAIIGEPQSGKSTLLRNSGLDFPIGDAQIHGIGGTKNCDWWFANEAIILDTAGRYAFEVQSAPDRDEWARFLGLLKKTRRKKAINGLLVTVPTDSLLQKNDDELRIYAQHLRGKINDIMTKLGIVFPVYFVVTKVDLVEGFVDFFGRYPQNRVREAVGRTFDNVHPGTSVHGASKTLDDLYDRLCSMSLGLMVEADPGEPARPYLMFPEEFRNLADRLKVFVEALLRENIYMRNPVFRGCYITSGTQEGRTIAAAVRDLADKLGLDVDSLTRQYEEDQPKRAYFVRDLLSKILIEDAQRKLVRPVKMGAGEQFMQAFGKVILPTAAVAILLLAWAFGGYFSNRGAWGRLTDYVAQNRYLGGGARQEDAKTSEAIQALADLGPLRVRAVDRSAFLNLYLTRSDPAPVLFNQSYTKAVETHVLNPTLARFKASLEGRPDSPGTYLEDLAAYAAYRRMALEKNVTDQAFLEELAAPWGRPDDRHGVLAKKKDLAAILSSYVQVGGQETGSIDFSRVASNVQEFLDQLQSEDPAIRLRDLARAAEMPVRLNTDSQQIMSLWSRLQEIVAAGSGALAVPPKLLTRMQEDMQAIREAEPALGAVRQLAGFLGRAEATDAGAGGKQSAFSEKVVKPLREARDLSIVRCPIPNAQDPQSVAKDLETYDTFAKEITQRVEAVRHGIDAFNADMPSDEQVNAAVIADLVHAARLSAQWEDCTRNWFCPDGPLCSRPLIEGCGGGRSAAPPLIGEAGRCFVCLEPMPSGGGGGCTPGLLAPLDAAVKNMADVRKVSSDLTSAFRADWTDNYRAATGGGPSLLDERVISKVRLASDPNTWDWVEMPERLLGCGEDGSLKDIVSKIINAGSPRARQALLGFNVDSYADSLKEIATKLQVANRDGTGLKLLEYANTVLGSDSTEFDNAVRIARRVGEPRLKATLEGVPKLVLKEMLEQAALKLDEYYLTEIKSQAEVLRRCTPFASSGAPCEPVAFLQMFGPGGAVSKLAGFASTGAGASATVKFGESLPVGPKFMGFLGSLARVYRSYAGGPEPGFLVELDTEPTDLRPEGKIKRDKILVKVESITLALGNASLSYANEAPQRFPARILVERDGSRSSLKVKLSQYREEGWLEMGAYEEKDLGAGQIEASGPWSFLELLEKGKPSDSPRDCCRWEIDVNYEKKQEKVATIPVRFRLRVPAGGSSILGQDFWRIESPPQSVRE